MKPFCCLFFKVWLAIAILVASASAETDFGKLASAVAHVLEENHYSHKELNTELSRELTTGYLEELDPDHLYFLRSDVDKIQQEHAETLGADILAGNLKPAFEIYEIFRKRID